MSADEWESLPETLFWLSQPGIQETLAEAEEDIRAERTFSSDEVRARLRLPSSGS